MAGRAHLRYRRNFLVGSWRKRWLGSQSSLTESATIEGVRD